MSEYTKGHWLWRTSGGVAACRAEEATPHYIPCTEFTCRTTLSGNPISAAESRPAEPTWINRWCMEQL